MNLAANPSTLQSATDLNLDPYWMPFTHNRYFKKHHPLDRLLVSAEGAYYTTVEGKRLFDCLSGLWCSSLGHRPAKVVEAVKRQLDRADYIPAFQVASPDTFRLAERIAEVAPGDLNRVFFTNSGSEAVDTSLKIALAYHRLRGEASRTRFIGREKGYHGVGFGGISVGGMVANRKMFAPAMIPGVDHLPHTYNAKEMAFSKGQPAWGAHLADELERLVALHDASTIAAVIVEPMQGSVGVVVPPLGYLTRLRNLRQARHPADLRRSDLRFRPHGQLVRRAGLRHDAGPDHVCQGRQQRHRADGRRDCAPRHLRRVHAGPRVRR